MLSISDKSSKEKKRTKKKKRENKIRVNRTTCHMALSLSFCSSYECVALNARVMRLRNVERKKKWFLSNEKKNEKSNAEIQYNNQGSQNNIQ